MPAKPILAATLLLALPGAASASRVLWLGELPPEAQRAQAERSTGPADHMDSSALAWPSQPDAVDQARQALDELEVVQADCEARWQAFDVEQDIAWRLGEAVDRLALVPDPAGRDALFQALVLQGAAVFWAWSPQEREQTEAAQPYLVSVGGERLLQPWVDAVALAPDREPARGDLPDQASYQAFLHHRELLLEQRRAVLVPVGLPQDAALMVDGVAQSDQQTIELVPGFHHVHLDRDGRAAAPVSLRLTAGQRYDLLGLVTVADLDKAGERVLAGNLLDVPQPVKNRVDALREGDREPFYLASWSGRGSPQAYLLDGAEPWKLGEFEPGLRVLADLGLGAGILGSTAFAEFDGTNPHVAAATVLDFGAQLAWKRWAALFEVAIHDTADRASIEYGEVATHTNMAASSFGRISVAPGFYVLRLRPRRPSFLVALPLGIMTPAHSGLGAQAWFGIPVGRSTWLRLGFDWFKANELPAWQELDGGNDTLSSLSLRVGVSQKLH